jgi:4-amino-4-deoxychorismate lyase
MIIAASFDINDPNNWNNRALQYGDGIFETMRLHHNKIPLSSWHQSRLQKGLKRLNLQALDWWLIENKIKQHCPIHLQRNAVIKLVVFRRSQGRTYQPKSTEIEWMITVSDFIAGKNKAPFHLAVAKTKLFKNKRLAGIKHLNRLEQVMIANELNEADDVDDLLVLDEKNRVIETTCQNVVLIKNNQLYTPKIKNCGIKGVGLKWLNAHFNLTSIHINIKDMAQFDGMMVGNSVRGFGLVSAIHGQHSFVTSQLIHDKIVLKWNETFN